MPQVARGTFDVTITPAGSELGGTVDRFELRKHFHGQLEGDGEGVMLAAGDPSAGSAGYVAIETVRGVLDGRRGSLVLAQLGVMDTGANTLHYEVVPGSGTAELAGISGRLELVIEPDETHRFELTYGL